MRNTLLLTATVLRVPNMEGEIIKNYYSIYIGIGFWEYGPRLHCDKRLSKSSASFDISMGEAIGNCATPD